MVKAWPARQRQADLEVTMRGLVPELSLGTDVLKHLHLYIVLGEQALYVAPADGVPQPVSAKP